MKPIYDKRGETGRIDTLIDDDMKKAINKLAETTAKAIEQTHTSIEDVIKKRWEDHLADKEYADSGKKLLLVTNFVYDKIIVTFEDGTDLTYRDAFVIVDGTSAAVFTEHCGYHELTFPDKIICIGHKNDQDGESWYYDWKTKKLVEASND